MEPLHLGTERLRLRRWRESDLEPFAAINADPEVTEFLPRALTRSESDALVERIESHFRRHGFGLWALEVPGRFDLAGFVGLWPTGFESHFTPATEVGWRLARDAWGHGYATEAARLSMRDGFERLGLAEIVSFTSVLNNRSVMVMERLAMTRSRADDFDHPSLDPQDALAPHVLYRMPASRFRATARDL